MAWFTRYMIPFQSQNGTQYMVNIYEKTSGNIITLKGAAEPFTTNEDDSDSIFTPFRGQTGSLRIIDETPDGSLLETLMPQNNTEKRVCLYTGSWNSSYTSFTVSELKWQGFLCAEAFTQPWDNNQKILEFPIKSFLSALDDVSIQSSNASLEANIAKLIQSAFSSLEIVPTSFVFISDLSSVTSQFLQVLLTWSVFFKEEIISNDTYTYKELIGISYKEAISYIASLYGLTVREKGSVIYFVQYDNAFNTRLLLSTYNWSDIATIAGGSTITPSASAISDLSLLSNVNFKDKNNVTGFLQGRKTAKVILNISDLSLDIELPLTAQDSSTVVDVSYIVDGHAYVQPHEPRTMDIELFYFKKVQVVSQGSPNIYYVYTIASTATYQQCRDNTVLFLPQYSVPTDYDLYTGAFPCRWFYLASGNTANVVLKNGLFLNQESVNKNSDVADSGLAYSIESELQFKIFDGYIHIDMQQHSFINGYRSALLHWDFDSLPTADGFKTELVVGLKVGSQYWNGTEWTSTDSTFTIPFVNTTIETNKTPAMNVAAQSGWFIPVSTELNGTIKLMIYNVVYTYPSPDYRGNSRRMEAHSRIISDLTVDFLHKNALSATDNNNNTYQQTILLNGFNGQEELNLSVGTINNNYVASCFIKSSSGYIESLSYNLPSSGTETMRPEKRLLERLVSQFSSVRRTMVANIQTGNDIQTNRFTYLSKKFFGIDKKHNWRNDTQEVKFIEVS